MTTPNFCTFTCSTVDDGVENSLGDYIEPPGRITLNAVSKHIPSASDVFQLDHYGWEFVFRTSSKRRASCVLQGDCRNENTGPNRWLILVTLLPNWLDWGRAQQNSQSEAIKIIDTALRTEQFMEIKWQSRAEYESRV